jgi:hypothetical protein
MQLSTRTTLLPNVCRYVLDVKHRLHFLALHPECQVRNLCLELTVQKITADVVA